MQRSDRPGIGSTQTKNREADFDCMVNNTALSGQGRVSNLVREVGKASAGRLRMRGRKTTRNLAGGGKCAIS